jgi:carbon monoxide dehydrogenase subunit G
MACIHKEFPVERSADAVWEVVRDVGQAHRRLFPGMLKDVRIEGDARIVSFANGLVLRELIVSLDDALRRVAYASVGGRATHHNASIQVLPDGANRCRIVWTTDLLPDTLVPDITALVNQGSAVMKRTLESPLTAP